VQSNGREETLLELLVQWEELRCQGKSATPEELCPDDLKMRSLLKERLLKRQHLQAVLDMPGSTLNDRLWEPGPLPVIDGYGVGELLGRGGMGVVYRARQYGLERDVALKIIISGAHASGAELARFRAEAEAVARLQHPGIVQVYEVGEQAGCPYLALELVRGGSLAQRLGGTPMPPRAAAQLVLELARAVQHAHEQGVVHRDLKPANVLLTESGIAKIADFGLAKTLATDSGLTESGAILGSPSYMAPEQAEGKVRSVSPLTDIYSLGAILYESLTGRPPFLGASVIETLDQVRSFDPVPPQTLQPKVSIDLAAICLKCLEKRPSQRYPSAAALAEDITRFLNDEPVSARNMTFFDQMTRLLSYRQIDVNFAAWSNMELCLAPIPVIAQVIVFAFFRERSFYPQLALGVTLATLTVVIYATLFGKRASLGLVSRPQRRQLLNLWLNHLIGIFLIPLSVVRMVHPTTMKEWFLIYALWLLQAGGTFFDSAAYAGLFYVTGCGCFALALLVPWIPLYTPLIVGCLMTANMTTLGLLLRRLARESVAD
jgi:serine/threonine protein kinase